MFDAAALLQSLPTLPGVYRMLDGGGQVLYVGKAKDLKKRVSSYFQKTGHSPRISLMLKQVAQVETTVTRTEAEALILENNLIKGLNPRFNILFRDDKSYPYAQLSGHPFPRLSYYRGPLAKPHQYFGPYPNAWAAKEAINLIQRVFRLRTCEDSVFSNRSRPCLLYQIRRCSGPCAGLISAADYARDVHSAALLLQGKDNELSAALTQRMGELAERQEYEAAAALRDQIHSLARLSDQQFVDAGRATDADVVACVVEQGLLAVNLTMIRNGRHLGDRTFFPEHGEGCTPAEALAAFLAQHYPEQRPPATILLNHAIDGAALEALLSEQAGHAVRLVAQTSGARRVWLAMAEKNARLAAQRRLLDKSSQTQRLEKLREALDLPGASRIECFDISHTLGEATVASCVAYDGEGLRKSDYRRYNITGITPGDDYAAMAEALARRYRHTAAGDGPRPDLVLIDGGKGQLARAVAVMAELGLNDIPLVGVAKGEERKPGLETLVFPDGRELHLATDNPGFHLIQSIRDEAHRFAITGHRARRAKSRLSSTLEDIPGIGPKRRKALLERFGGLQGVQRAGVEELARAPGISRELAEKIYQNFH